MDKAGVFWWICSFKMNWSISLGLCVHHLIHYDKLNLSINNYNFISMPVLGNLRAKPENVFSIYFRRNGLEAS